ncbi:hypothetical protein RSSM_02315 [Rhodopirellula sallentina SM41]|uniref:Uncharacterized protein n=1 Tax=Rhodopirellula sallentina SM41 TaxID=1263870 RepID=M5U4R1_9BACT|nr:hypothetical protein RSSM_02315 [Rhodopirellula sallentina SM41]
MNSSGRDISKRIGSRQDRRTTPVENGKSTKLRRPRQVGAFVRLAKHHGSERFAGQILLPSGAI